MLIEEATENDDGDLIYEREIPGPQGTTQTEEINVSALFTPGQRKTGSVEHLLVEARLYDEEEGNGNPAKPVNAEVAKQALGRMEQEGIEPAWRQVENAGEFL